SATRTGRGAPTPSDRASLARSSADLDRAPIWRHRGGDGHRPRAGGVASPGAVLLPRVGSPSDAALRPELPGPVGRGVHGERGLAALERPAHVRRFPAVRRSGLGIRHPSGLEGAWQAELPRGPISGGGPLVLLDGGPLSVVASGWRSRAQPDGDRGRLDARRFAV